MEKQLTWTNFYNHPRTWRHLIVWALVFAFFWAAGSRDTDVASDELHKVFLYISIFVGLIYYSFYVYNRFSKTREYVKLFALLSVGITIAAFIDEQVHSSVSTVGEIKGFWANMIVFPMMLLVAFGVKLSYRGSVQALTIEKLRRKTVEGELKLLKSQINPHFLFNTLNNIYATNLEDHNKANDIILELADLLRYQLESDKKDKVLLSTEIKNLKGYINLEKIRVKDCVINFTENGEYGQAEISPLLLLPLIENAFKYGTGIKQGNIEVKTDFQDGTFSFSCKNNIVQSKGKIHSGGIGLQNVQKRLELMYSNSHEFDIKQTKGRFEVELKVRL